MAERIAGIVLGKPLRPDGSLGPLARSRVQAAAIDWHAGRVDLLVLCGGAAYTDEPEAEAMAKSARQLGVPEHRLIEEGTSRNTDENGRRAADLLLKRGFRRAKVYADAPHLKRALYLFRDLPLKIEGRPVMYPRDFPLDERITHESLEYALFLVTRRLGHTPLPPRWLRNAIGRFAP